MVFGQIFTPCRSSSRKKEKKIDKDFARKPEFEDIKFPVAIRDIHKISKMNYISVSIFVYESKEKYPIYASKNTFRRHVDLLLKEKEDKKHYVFVVIARYYFVVIITFSTAEISKCYVNNRFKINGKQMICLKKMNMWDSKPMKRK